MIILSYCLDMETIFRSLFRLLHDMKVQLIFRSINCFGYFHGIMIISRSLISEVIVVTRRQYSDNPYVRIDI
jgi:hypothetical protein